MKNVIQDYAWGSLTAIPELLGYTNDENKPQAELWMGSHNRGDSKLLNNNGEVSLASLIAEDQKGVLSEETASRFGDLPFLFKVLAAGSPLSIQVHPEKKQAEIGFARENEKSIPLGAYNRNYKDDNHKPEIICAITPFWAMRGFRKIDSIVENFQNAKLPSFQKFIDKFSTERNSEGLKSFFSSIMSLEGEAKKTFIKELVDVAKNRDSDIYDWVLRFYKKYPDDAAIAAPLYLNLVKLNPGEALFLSSGELHAYVDGLGMELMASSDNVLRGGLTPKFIDREELKSILNFAGADPQILTAESVDENLAKYSTPTDEFELSRIDLKEDETFVISKDNLVQILFVAQGQAQFSSEKGDFLSAEKGESIFVPFESGNWTISGDALLYRASIPGDR